MTRPRLLDLFCGAGGAAMGYYRAGFDVVGVDIRPQPRYPFTFHQNDALEYPLDGFDVIHASPPCQDYSRNLRSFVEPGAYPRLIDPVRVRLRAADVPWVIENVPGAPLPTQPDLFGAHGIELCGSMFGLRLWRHRLFETSFSVHVPRGCDHSQLPINPYWSVNRQQWKDAGVESVGRFWREQMDVAWMTSGESSEAIPPAYTEYIGHQLLEHIATAAA